MMSQVVCRGAAIGMLAAALVTIALVACGAVELGNGLIPLNCVSHILWGDVAFDQTGLTVRYTLAGFLLNAAAVLMWGIAFEAFLFATTMRLSRVGANAAAVIVTATAYVVDYYIVPARFTPGFEARLSATSLLVVYVSLAAGLVLGDRVVRLYMRQRAHHHSHLALR